MNITFKCDYFNEHKTGFERIYVLVISEVLKYINGGGSEKTEAVVVWFALEWAEILFWSQYISIYSHINAYHRYLTTWSKLGGICLADMALQKCK